MSPIAEPPEIASFEDEMPPTAPSSEPKIAVQGSRHAAEWASGTTDGLTRGFDDIFDIFLTFHNCFPTVAVQKIWGMFPTNQFGLRFAKWPTALTKPYRYNRIRELSNQIRQFNCVEEHFHSITRISRRTQLLLSDAETGLKTKSNVHKSQQTYGAKTNFSFEH